MAKYLEDRDLLYEIILSKGKGTLTKNAENYFILVAENVIRVKEKTFRDIDERNDCLYQGILHLFCNWRNFNEKKYTFALPYITEIFKRGMTDGHNKLHNKKPYHKEKPRLISISSSNNGKGLHNLI